VVGEYIEALRQRLWRHDPTRQHRRPADVISPTSDQPTRGRLAGCSRRHFTTALTGTTGEAAGGLLCGATFPETSKCLPRADCPMATANGHWRRACTSTSAKAARAHVIGRPARCRGKIIARRKRATPVFAREIGGRCWPPTLREVQPQAKPRPLSSSRTGCIAWRVRGVKTGCPCDCLIPDRLRGKRLKNPARRLPDLIARTKFTKSALGAGIFQSLEAASGHATNVSVFLPARPAAALPADLHHRIW